MKLGENDIKLYLGSAETKVYLGTTQVYPSEEPAPVPYEEQYLTFESLDDNNTIYLKATNTAITKTVSASTDNGETWTEYTSSTGNSGTTLATLNKGDKLLVKGENSAYATSLSNYNQFTTTGEFEVKGNIMSLISGDSFANANELTESYTFGCLFRQCTGLTSAEHLILPATTLTSYCYVYMFQNCSGLTSAPDISATTLADFCCTQMFENCYNLTTAPSTLPATTLANRCYNAMFRNCSGLTTTPTLPATTLVDYCYAAMFAGCTSLTSATTLPAMTLIQYCYTQMFENCTSLTTAPELSATTLANRCYNAMFRNCTRLSNITCLATNISASNCTTAWVQGVASTGTFVKASSMTSWTTGTGGIPTGWTVQNA